MSDGLHTTRDRLRCELAAARSASFESARARRPELASFASILDVLEALESRSNTSDERRHAIVAELVREHRATKSAMWSKALVVAFYPAMQALRARLALGGVGLEEIDQVIVTGFLNAIAALPEKALGHFAAFRICRRMERYVFRFLASERGFRRLTTSAHEDDTAVVPQVVGDGPDPTAYDRVALGFLLRCAGKHGVSPSTLALLEVTAFEGTSLSALAKQIEPHDAHTRKRLYERLKRRRSRALRRLRALADVPERSESVSLQVHDAGLE